MQNDYYQNMDVNSIMYLNNIGNDFMENILKKTEKIKAKVYMSFPYMENNKDKVFEGIIEFTGKDYILLNDVSKKEWYLLPLVFMNYIQFEENLDKYL